MHYIKDKHHQYNNLAPRVCPSLLSFAPSPAPAPNLDVIEPNFGGCALGGGGGRGRARERPSAVKHPVAVSSQSNPPHHTTILLEPFLHLHLMALPCVYRQGGMPMRLVSEGNSFGSARGLKMGPRRRALCVLLLRPAHDHHNQGFRLVTHKHTTPLTSLSLHFHNHLLTQRLGYASLLLETLNDHPSSTCSSSDRARRERESTRPQPNQGVRPPRPPFDCLPSTQAAGTQGASPDHGASSGDTHMGKAQRSDL